MALPYKRSKQGKKLQVESMFNNIAPRYDFLNHFLSLGIDRSWRKKTVNAINKHLSLQKRKNIKVLDVATGTADLAIAASRIERTKITGIDISEEMLEIGRKKIHKKGLEKVIHLQKGDAENIEFPDNYFDAIIVAFGVRNFEHLERGLLEMSRVLKPGGILSILELSTPEKPPMKNMYRFYFLKILPFFGKLFSKDNSAYQYLPTSVIEFPQGNYLKEIVLSNGFAKCYFKPLTFSTVHLYNCIKKMPVSKRRKN